MSKNTGKKLIVFLTQSTGKKATSAAMLKAIDSHPVKPPVSTEARPLEIAPAGPLNHLQPLLKNLDERKKQRCRITSKPPATTAETTRATGKGNRKQAAPKVKTVKATHHA